MRPRFTFDSLVPGMGFGFLALVGAVLPGGVAIGQVVGLEPNNGIVHVRTFRPGSDPECNRPDIGFILMLFTSFRRSVRFLHAHGPVPNDVWPILSAWRERHALGQVGAFVPSALAGRRDGLANSSRVRAHAILTTHTSNTRSSSLHRALLPSASSRSPACPSSRWKPPNPGMQRTAALAADARR